jgi:hypothetical protein
VLGQRLQLPDTDCSRLNPEYSFEGYLGEVSVWASLLSALQVRRATSAPRVCPPRASPAIVCAIVGPRRRCSSREPSPPPHTHRSPPPYFYACSSTSTQDSSPRMLFRLVCCALLSLPPARPYLAP